MSRFLFGRCAAKPLPRPTVVRSICATRGRKVPMLKLTKRADYGLIAMRHLAEHAGRGAFSAKDLAETYGMPQEVVAKILQRLVKARLLVSKFGTDGGYVLARDPRRITAFEVIQAIDGPMSITSCVTLRGCERETRCTVREPLAKVSRGIAEVLDRMTLWEMTQADPELVSIRRK
jgi:Rrf2 family protein